MLVRDPRDVVISNLFQNFQLNRMMHAHCRLEDIVRQYQTVLDFYLQCRRWSQARLLEVKYETLIADPERVLRGVVGWLGLEWKPEILEYRSEIPRRTVRTPSYRQIARPIYQSSGGRWRNYQKQIAAFQGELQPYLQTFEYEQY